MTDQSWNQISFNDLNARSSPILDFEDRGLLAAAVESGPTATAPNVTPPPFCPVLEGRLFTAHDSTIEADCEVHPTARLLYDELPQHFRDVFKHCPMYLEKHLEFVKYLHHLSLNDLDKKNEPSSERNLIKTLGIQVSTEEGNKKKWQCGAVGCEYRGTLQHLVSHLRTKSHIGIPTFECTLDQCKMLFHHSQDRDRHVKEKTCLKSRVEDPAERQGSTRSLRGVQDQFVAMPKPKGKSRANQQSARGGEYQIPTQTSAQGINDSRSRKAAHYDPSFRGPGNAGHYNPGPSTSFAPAQPLVTPVHLTPAYHQAHANVPTTQNGRAGMHPTSQPPATPDFFPAASILPMNNGGMYATVITNNHHIHGTTDNFQPINDRHFTPGPQPVNQGFNHPTSLPFFYPSFDPRVTTGYQDPGQSSTSHSTNFADNFYGNDPPQPPDRRPRDPRQPPPYTAQNHGRSVHRNEGGGKKWLNDRAHGCHQARLLLLYSEQEFITNVDSFIHRFTVVEIPTILAGPRSTGWSFTLKAPRASLTALASSGQLEKFNQLRMLFADLICTSAAGGSLGAPCSSQGALYDGLSPEK